MKNKLIAIGGIYALYTAIFIFYVHYIHVGNRPDDLAFFSGPIGWLVFPSGLKVGAYVASTFLFFGICLGAIKAQNKHKFFSGCIYLAAVIFWFINGLMVNIAGV
jgi:hypothetical protein